MEIMRRQAWQQLAVTLLGMLVFVPAIAVPDTWSGIRILGMQAVALGFLALSIVSAARWSAESVKRFITTGPHLALLLLIIWAAVSFAQTATGSERSIDLARAEFLRLTCGAAIYFAAGSFCRSDQHFRLVSSVLLAGCVAVALAGIVGFSPSSKAYVSAGFGDSQLLGAFLTGLFPLTVALTWSASTSSRFLLSSVATSLVGVALLQTGNRSGWIGALVGLVVVGVLTARSGMLRLADRPTRGRRQRSALPAVVAAPALICLYLAVSGAGMMVLDRARTLTTLSTDGSVVTRLHTWQAAGEMLRQRPLTGWGIGSFPLRFAAFYESNGGDQTRYPVPSAALVARDGPGLSSMAHNEYLQLGAELGLIGLTLYVTVFGGFFFRGVRALRHMQPGPRRTLLLATLGAVAAECVDGLSNPGWRFADVSPLLWLMLGLGMAAARPRMALPGRRQMLVPGGYQPRLAGPLGQLAAAVLATTCVGALFVENAQGASGQPSAGYARIRVDANRDGHITFGDDLDQTTPVKRFRFWLNNDRDLEGVYKGESDEQDDAKPDSGPPDSDDLDIANDRDLEDFTRIHLKAPDEFDPLSSLWQCTLQFTAGTPVVNVYEAVAPGIEYLTDGATAAVQRRVSYRATVRWDVAREVPGRLFANADKAAYLLFEAHKAGEGTLTVRFYRAGQLAGEDHVYLSLKDIKKMYDHFTVGDSTDVSLGHILTTAERAHEHEGGGPIQVLEDPPDTPDYIMFVHGWRMEPWERRAFAETAFKRLWHRGYKGAFGLFSWPTEFQEISVSGLIANPINYDESEQKAFVSARGLAGLLAHLRGQYSGGVRVLAHSMGNIVVGEALRQHVEGNPDAPLVHSYIASQAAVPAHAYDPCAPDFIRARLRRYPNVYADYPDGLTPGCDVAFPYFGTVFAAVSGTMANYYNEQDFALSNYSLNQGFKPIDSTLLPHVGVTYAYRGTTHSAAGGFYKFTHHGADTTQLDIVADRYEIFAFAAPSHSKALGEQENISRSFTELVDLQAEFKFGSEPRGHSAQFRSTFWKRYRYWDRVLGTFGL